QEHHVAFFALVLADEQLASTCGSLPRDPPERIAGLMLPELADIAAVSREGARAPLIGVSAAAAAARRAGKARVRARQHLDAARIREGEGHFEQPWTALHFEREPVDGVAPHAAPGDAQRDPESASGGHFAANRRELDVERGRGNRAEPDVARGTNVPIPHLGFELERLPARQAEGTGRAAPQHLEPRAPHLRDAD